MNFGKNILIQSMRTEQNFVPQILIDSFIIYIKTEDFLKIFLMMLRDGLIRLTMIKMITDLF